MENCFDPGPADGVVDHVTWEETKTECCHKIESEDPPDDGRLYCNITWDTWDCWNWTPAGQTSYHPCPSWIHGSDPKQLAYKTCMEDGTWFVSPLTNSTWTDYRECGCPETVNKSSLYMYYVGYFVSTISSAIALFIFCHFKSLGCPRVTIHKNLFVSFILCGAFNLSWHVVMKYDYNVYCKIFHGLATYFILSNYLWMLSEGLYLHKVIVVAVFSENHNLLFYYIIGWVVPALPTALFVFVNLVHGFEDCWTSAQTSWILGMSALLVTIINLGFLLNIVRVLVTKLRALQSQGPTSRSYAKAVRATLILLPLMGIPWIILPIQPQCSVMTIVYDYINYFLTAGQGFIVACIFCFFNGEVKMQIRRKWIPDNWKKRRGSDFRFRNTTVTVMSDAVSTTPRQSLHITSDKEGDGLLSDLPNGKKHLNGKGNEDQTNKFKLIKSKNIDFRDVNKNIPEGDAEEPFFGQTLDSDTTTPV